MLTRNHSWETPEGKVRRHKARGADTRRRGREFIRYDWHKKGGTAGAAPTDHRWGAMMDFKQENDAISFLLEEAHAGCNMQNRSEGAKVRMERCHCQDLGLNRWWPELTE